MYRAVLAASAIVGVLIGLGVGSAAPGPVPAPADKVASADKAEKPVAAPAEKSSPKSDRLAPVLMGTADLKAPAKKPAEGRPVKPPAPIVVDEKARSVRAAVTLTRTKGVVEWVLSSSRKHPAASVMVAENSAAEFAAALAKAGYDTGTPAAIYGEDKARPPAGQPMAIDLVVTREGGKVDRIPAQKFLSAKSAGDPVSDGTWVYVGPQAIREGEVDILVTELSGSVITTNLRDSSAMVFWMPTSGDDSPAAATYFASNAPMPGEADRCEIEIRPAAALGPAPAR